MINIQLLMIARFFLNLELFTNLPLPQNFLERRKVATKERKKEIAYNVSSFLFVEKWIKHPEGSEGFPLD